MFRATCRHKANQAAVKRGATFDLHVQSAVRGCAVLAEDDLVAVAIFDGHFDAVVHPADRAFEDIGAAGFEFGRNGAGVVDPDVGVEPKARRCEFGAETAPGFSLPNWIMILSRRTMAKTGGSAK